MFIRSGVSITDMTVGDISCKSLIILLLLHGAVLAQEFPLQGIKMTHPVICYASDVDHNLVVPARNRASSTARTKTATIEVEYIDFPANAQQAFQYAVDIWETLITSPVTIHVRAQWIPLSEGVLGSAIYASAFANFENAPLLNVYYPVAVAEKIAGKNLNDPTAADIFAQFSSTFQWHLDPETTPLPGTYDFVTVVLHEIGHGLGFTSSFFPDGIQGDYGLSPLGYPVSYDIAIENEVSDNLIRTTETPSPQFLNLMTSNALFYNSTYVMSSTGEAARLYAPSVYNSGSSISHLNEATYTGADALMTPNIASQESIHDPGISLNILQDLGWAALSFGHTPLKSTEDSGGPYPVTVNMGGDNWSDGQPVTLFYAKESDPLSSAIMASGGTPGAYTASILSSGEGTYYYYVETADDLNRVFTSPGKIVVPMDNQQQAYHQFEVGPDTEPPAIKHVPPNFLLDTNDEFVVKAIVTDNLGVDHVSIEYQYNNDPLQSISMSQGDTDSTYAASIPISGAATIGDILRYRITAVDGAMNPNETNDPSAGFYGVSITGLAPTQDAYSNDFNSPTDDFFGTGFSIAQPPDFNDAAIHSVHPYPEGNPYPGMEIDIAYQLRIPIRIQHGTSLMEFDEIVLVEPGEANSIFPSESFYDYVVVEGSVDGGQTWTPVADGYDSRSNPSWLSAYNGLIVGNNSNAVGKPSMYRPRMFNLSEEFDAGEEVVLRFRLHSDPYASGWGWAIDNLKIQIDHFPPIIRHDQVDYIAEGSDPVLLSVTSSDESGLEKLMIETIVNDAEADTVKFLVAPAFDTYELSLNVDAVSSGDTLRYRIIAQDSLGLTGYLPEEGYFVVPVVSFEEPVHSYFTDFNSANTDFAGTYFTISNPNDFSSPLLHSTIPYAPGFGPELKSDFTSTLLKPVIINPDNPRMVFNEVALVEGHSQNSTIEDEAFKDYVIVEGSSDAGSTWLPVADGYDCIAYNGWLSSFQNGASGSGALLRSHQIDLTANGNFSADDEIILRFRLHSNASITGWGWGIDDLHIQDAVTDVPENKPPRLRIYPNPVIDNKLNIETAGDISGEWLLHLYNLQGQGLFKGSLMAADPDGPTVIDFSSLPPGVYLLECGDGKAQVIRRIMKIQ